MQFSLNTSAVLCCSHHFSFSVVVLDSTRKVYVDILLNDRCEHEASTAFKKLLHSLIGYRFYLSTFHKTAHSTKNTKASNLVLCVSLTRAIKHFRYRLVFIDLPTHIQHHCHICRKQQNSKAFFKGSISSSSYRLRKGANFPQKLIFQSMRLGGLIPTLKYHISWLTVD